MKIPISPQNSIVEISSPRELCFTSVLSLPLVTFDQPFGDLEKKNICALRDTYQTVQYLARRDAELRIELEKLCLEYRSAHHRMIDLRVEIEQETSKINRRLLRAWSLIFRAFENQDLQYVHFWP